MRGVGGRRTSLAAEQRGPGTTGEIAGVIDEVFDGTQDGVVGSS